MILLKLVYKSEIWSTTIWFTPPGPEMSTLSLISYGCLTNRKMQDPRNSCAVAEKTNDRESNAVLVVDKIEWKPVSKKLTGNMSQ